MTNTQVAEQLAKNIDYFVGHYGDFFRSLSDQTSDLVIHELEPEDFQVLQDGNILYDRFLHQARHDLDSQIRNPRYVKAARVINSCTAQPPASQIFHESIDSHRQTWLDNAYALSDNTNADAYSYDHILLLGALSLPFVIENLKSSPFPPPSSLTVVDIGTRGLAVSSMFFDMHNILSYVSQSKIKFNLIFASSFSDARERVYELYASKMIGATLNLRVLTSLDMGSELRDLHTWLFTDYEFGYRFIASLGTSVDEFNQFIETYIGLLLADEKSTYLLPKNIGLYARGKCIVCGSGPSLDSNIATIRLLQGKGWSVCCAASSVRTLLLNDITPDYCVILERGPELYNEFHALAEECPLLSKVVLIRSIQADHRFSNLFKSTMLYQRPFSASSWLTKELDGLVCLPHAGPESINSAFESMVYLGFSTLLLVGADLGSVDRVNMRSALALGRSERSMSVRPASGNLGKTIFTTTPLTLTGKSLDHVAAMFPNLKFYRIGEGLCLNSFIDLADADQLEHQSCSSDYIESDEILRNLFNSARLSIFSQATLQRLDKGLDEWWNSLREALSGVESWPSSVHLEIIANYSCTNHLSVDPRYSSGPYHLFFNRLFRQQLYFMLYPLFASSTLDQYRSRLDIFLQSFGEFVSTLSIAFDFLGIFQASDQSIKSICKSKPTSKIIDFLMP